MLQLSANSDYDCLKIINVCFQYMHDHDVVHRDLKVRDPVTCMYVYLFASMRLNNYNIVIKNAFSNN